MRDPYLYDDVPVLKNKLNIKDVEKLEAAEADITFIKLLSIDKLNQEQDLDFNYVKAIHKHIFEDIYPFAGEARTIQIYKAEPILGGDTIRYMPPSEIEKGAKSVLDNMANIKWLQLNMDERSRDFSQNIAALWQVHAFREGNTRTTMTFACHFADRYGFPLDKQLFKENAAFVRNALVKASDGQYSDLQFLHKIMYDSMNLGAERLIINEIKDSNFRPTNMLIKRMKDVNQAFQKPVTIKELIGLYKNIRNFDNEKGQLIKLAAQEFIDQELQMKKMNNIKQIHDNAIER